MTTEVTDNQITDSSPTLDLRILGETLADIPRRANDETSAITELLRIVSRLTSAKTAVYIPTDAAGKIVDGGVIETGQCDEECRQQIWKLTNLTIGERSVQTARRAENSNEFILCVPIPRPRHSVEAIAVVMSAQNPARILPGVAQVLQLIAAFTAQWRGRVGEERVDQKLHLYSVLSTLLSTASQETTESQFAEKLATGLRHEFGADSVAFIQAKQAKMRVLALSPAKKFDRHSELAKAFVTVAEEAQLKADSEKQLNSFPLALLNTESTRKLASLVQTDHINCLVLRNFDRSISGFCLLMSGDARRELHEIASSLIGDQHELYQKAKPRFLGRIRIAYRRAFRRQWILNFGIPIVAVALLLATPFPLQVKTKCTVQPEKKRYIAAPYDGRLEEVFVEPGDVVNQGDVLARMDAQEIRWELGVVSADYNRARKQRDAAMAPGARDESTAQIAKFEMERLELKRKLLQDREANLDIKSPTDGVVISGDPKKLEGARLTMGQTLAEVGPMEENIFELEIDDADIRHVAIGDPVRIKLDSMPTKTLYGTLDLIHPQAEQRGDRNVFIGDVKVEASDRQQLRPGMKGTAKITGPTHALGWNLFHKAWEQLLFRFGW